MRGAAGKGLPPGVVEAVFDNPEALAAGAAQWLLERALAGGDRVAIALSGGSTPRRLYEFLASPPVVDRFPWPRVHWFLGDERFVPHDHPDSNYGMARRAMFDRAPVPPANLHPVPFEGAPEDAARAYERQLVAFHGSPSLKPGRPLFDVVLLGLGPDGHTASLFPGVPALEERSRWVVAVVGAKPEPRITLTYPALDSTHAAAFLVAGAEKRDMLRRVRSGEAGLPAARIRPAGTLHWFVDRAALSEGT